MSDTRKPNPYRPPTARVARSLSDEDVVQRPKGMLVMPTILVFATFFASWMAPMIIGQFEDMFKGFGAEMPGLTRFVLTTRYAWVLFLVAAIALIAWIGKREERSRRELRLQGYALTALAVTFGLAVAVAFYALYLPILQLGRTV